MRVFFLIVQRLKTHKKIINVPELIKYYQVLIYYGATVYYGRVKVKEVPTSTIERPHTTYRWDIVRQKDLRMILSQSLLPHVRKIQPCTVHTYPL